VSCGRDCRGVFLVLDLADVLSGGAGTGGLVASGVGGTTRDVNCAGGFGNVTEEGVGVEEID
jgi:hypothetical protein